MTRNMILYRGGLKSCNYRCSYCPFSKHRMSGRELEKDRDQWQRFWQKLLRCAPQMAIGALMVVPYGEALIHSWYWEGLAALSASEDLDAVGAQTNLSFSVPDALKAFQERGGRPEKLRLWATFHPEMTSVDVFAEKCIQLTKAGVSLCAGAVGVPDNIELLKQLRKALPPKIYLWINQMDGRKRSYTKQEQAAFQKLDPYFLRELTFVRSDRKQCEGRLFVEGSGAMHTCNISPVLRASWYEQQDRLPQPECSRKWCSCYLAYGGRNDFMNQILFGPYPLFRIPRRPKAVFLDIDGTLIPWGADSVPKQTAEQLELLVKAEGSLLFFATSLPYEHAMKRCRDVKHLFCGGIFAGGAHIRLEGSGLTEAHKNIPKREHFYPMAAEVLPYLEEKRQQFRFRTAAYRQAGSLYKLTLIRPGHSPWKPEEADELYHTLPESLQRAFRYFTEANCLQIVDAGADKANGARTLCRWLDLEPSDTAAAGDSQEDRGMLAMCSGRPVAVRTAGYKSLDFRPPIV